MIVLPDTYMQDTQVIETSGGLRAVVRVLDVVGLLSTAPQLFGIARDMQEAAQGISVDDMDSDRVASALALDADYMLHALRAAIVGLTGVATGEGEARWSDLDGEQRIGLLRALRMYAPTDYGELAQQFRRIHQPTIEQVGESRQRSEASTSRCDTLE